MNYGVLRTEHFIHSPRATQERGARSTEHGARVVLSRIPYYVWIATAMTALSV